MSRDLNLLLRFLLELAALAALAYWGATASSGGLRWVLVVAAPVALAIAWGLFVSPKAAIAVPRLAQLAIEFALLGASALALVDAGQPVLGLIFGVLALVSGLINYARTR